jgi:hypothetical protein
MKSKDEIQPRRGGSGLSAESAFAPLGLDLP